MKLERTTKRKYFEQEMLMHKRKKKIQICRKVHIVN